MDEVIHVADQYYILAGSSLVDMPDRVLKHGETFAVFDRLGDVRGLGISRHGVFHEGTRFLSRLELRIGERRPLLLSSMARQDLSNLLVDLTNPDFADDEGVNLPRDTFHLFRSKFLWQGTCYERLRIRSYLMRSAPLLLEIEFAADFADLFEIRGQRRARRGALLDPQVTADEVTLAYRGLDGVVRRSRLVFSPPPRQLDAGRAVFELELGPGGETTLYMMIACMVDRDAPQPLPAFEAALHASYRSRAEAQRALCTIHSSNEQFNDWVNSSSADLLMMLTETPHGLYPYAGIPWFNTAFGRDGIITALQCLWAFPELGRGVLKFLAANQAREPDPGRDAEPGKILHETRRGEMANLGEIPFAHYYGTVDATPLFVVLAAAYHDATGDHETLDAIWDALVRALDWIDAYGDADGDGFVEYPTRGGRGLVQQGWKDSNDSVFHADGRLADGPIALCEVQGYVYAAWLAGARLAEARGLHPLAARCTHQAEALQQAFETAFWDEELGTYALALDGEKRPCRVRTSNAGHCLYTGIAGPEHALRVADTLLAADSFNGWGVRTVSSRERRFNPMSYHNGSVWPHDTALLASGLARYGLKEGCLRLLAGLMDASLFMELHRLPELFCGFDRRPSEGPTHYPVACSPQAWAVGSVYMMVQAALGLSIDQAGGTLRLDHPQLPPFIDWLRLRGLRVGRARIDLLVNRSGEDVGTAIEDREGEVELVIVK